jgi:Flp pilus assembly protein TadG
VNGDERGQASALLIGVLLLGLLVVGFAVDGARLFTARRDLQSVADSAALAGASAIDEGVYRETGGAEVRLDALAARRAIDEVVRASSLPATTRVDAQVTADRVVVRIARPVHLQFLGLTGLGPQQIGAHASAAPQTG